MLYFLLYICVRQVLDGWVIFTEFARPKRIPGQWASPETYPTASWWSIQPVLHCELYPTWWRNGCCAVCETNWLPWEDLDVGAVLFSFSWANCTSKQFLSIKAFDFTLDNIIYLFLCNDLLDITLHLACPHVVFFSSTPFVLFFKRKRKHICKRHGMSDRQSRIVNIKSICIWI